MGWERNGKGSDWMGEKKQVEYGANQKSTRSAFFTWVFINSIELSCKSQSTE